MKLLLKLILCSCGLLGPCAYAQSHNPGSAAVPAIDSFIRDYYAVMSERDWEEYQECFCEKATLTTIWSEDSGDSPEIHTSTIDEFIDQTHLGPDSQPIFEESPLHIDIDSKNGLASVWVLYEAKFGSEKELMEWTGYDMFSLIEHEGKWCIVSIAFKSLEE